MLSKLRHGARIAAAVGVQNIPRRLLHLWNVRYRLRRDLHPKQDAQVAYERSAGALLGAEMLNQWRDRAGWFLPTPSPEALRNCSGDEMFQANVIDTCDAALAGRQQYFSRWHAELGWPPNFNRDPLSDVDWPTELHWLDLLAKAPSDLKLVWEPSRLTLAMHLARAYQRTQDDKYAEAFWVLVDAWIEQNPPQMSVAWGCGQETAFRMMGMLFGAFATLHTAHATEPRLQALTRLMWQFGRRIEANINYARSQRNNHALSEAIGMWTVGALFPEFTESQRWRRDGQAILARELDLQVYRDGSYVQHSVTYHRVALDDVLWYLSLCRRMGEPVPTLIRDRFNRAFNWLWQMTDPGTGRAPNYGSNDGASVLPLSCSEYLDMRPTLQACSLALTGAPALPPGPWDEKPLWLGLAADMPASASVDSAPPRPPLWQARTGGYYILRGKRSQIMVRCHTYRDRPGQADMMHVDLMADGINLLRDGGSYSYNCPEPWKFWFKSTPAHNTVTIDNEDQMEHGPKFLWFSWSRAAVRNVVQWQNGECAQLKAVDFSYRRLPTKVTHERKIERCGDSYTIVDRLTGAENFSWALRWRLAPGEWERDGNAWMLKLPDSRWGIELQLPDNATCELLTGVEGDHPEGWESLHYGEKTPAPTVVAKGRAQADRARPAPITLQTRVYPMS